MRILILLLILITLNGCEDTSIGPSEIDKDFLPLSVGNYWIYQYYQLDMNKQKINESEFIDSVVVEKKEFVEDNLFTYYLVFYKDAIAYDTLLLRKKNNQIFFYENPDTNIKGRSERWLPKINLNMEFDESWNIFNEQIYNYNENLNGQKYIGTYYLTDNGRLVSEDSLLFDKKLYFSKKFNHKYDSRLQFLIFEKRYIDDNAYVIDTFVFNKIYQYTEEFKLMEGIGFSKMVKNPHRLSVFTNPSSTISYNKDFFGWERLLLRYSIKH